MLPAALRLVSTESVDEVIHDRRTVRFDRQLVQLPGHRGMPVLGMERTVLTGDPDGDLPAVLLVHGFGQNHRTWRLENRSMSGALAERGFDVYNLDLRGHGWSRRFGAPPARGVDDYVEDVVRVVRSLERPTFMIGHSLGGAIGIRTAPRVELAGFVHLAGIYTFANHSAILRGAAQVTRRIDRWLPDPGSLHLRPFGKALARPVFDRAIFRVMPVNGWLPGSMTQSIIDERLVAGFDRVGFPIWKEMARWATGEPIDPELGFTHTDVPLLVLAGEGDTLAHPQDGRAAYDASGSSDKTYVLFSDREHGYSPGHIDIIVGDRAPEIVWPVLFDWLESRS